MEPLPASYRLVEQPTEAEKPSEAAVEPKPPRPQAAVQAITPEQPAPVPSPPPEPSKPSILVKIFSWLTRKPEGKPEPVKTKPREARRPQHDGRRERRGGTREGAAAPGRRPQESVREPNKPHPRQTEPGRRQQQKSQGAAPAARPEPAPHAESGPPARYKPEQSQPERARPESTPEQQVEGRGRRRRGRRERTAARTEADAGGARSERSRDVSVAAEPGAVQLAQQPASVEVSVSQPLSAPSSTVVSEALQNHPREERVNLSREGGAAGPVEHAMETPPQTSSPPRQEVEIPSYRAVPQPQPFALPPDLVQVETQPEKARETAATRVDFYTLVRGEG